MAVADLMDSSLRLVFYEGEDMETGEPIYKSKSFNNVKTEATTDQLFTVANAFASLQTSVLYNVQRRDTSDIREE